MIDGLSWVIPISEDLMKLFRITYDSVKEYSSEYDHLCYLGEVFDDNDTQIWIDTWGHITPEGNKIIAGTLAQIICSNHSLQNNRPPGSPGGKTNTNIYK
jgi:hypothetical protein